MKKRERNRRWKGRRRRRRRRTLIGSVVEGPATPFHVEGQLDLHEPSACSEHPDGSSLPRHRKHPHPLLLVWNHPSFVALSFGEAARREAQAFFAPKHRPVPQIELPECVERQRSLPVRAQQLIVAVGLEPHSAWADYHTGPFWNTSRFV
jgi:hypothetical protein